MNDKDKQIVEEWMTTNTPTQQIAKKYGFATNKSITDRVKKVYPDLDIRTFSRDRLKTYKLDLANIDSSEKAYFLGLMYTDGYISTHTKFGIDLIDEDCIAWLAKVTNHKYNKYPGAGGTLPNGKSAKRKNRFRIIWSSKNNVAQLAKWGITPNKTSALKGGDLNKISSVYYPDLIRGIIDGDGCIYRHSNGRSIAFYIMSASESFASWCKELLEKIGMTNININKQNNLYKVESTTSANIRILHDIIYDKEYGMNRKRQHLREMFRDYNRSSHVE